MYPVKKAGDVGGGGVGDRGGGGGGGAFALPFTTIACEEKAPLVFF